jgi:hypothetical protein
MKDKIHWVAPKMVMLNIESITSTSDGMTDDYGGPGLGS